MKFESVRINEDENIACFLLKVDEIVNTIKGLGENFDEALVAQNVLRSLSS